MIQYNNLEEFNFFEHECYLNARVPRVKDDTGKLHTVMLGWSGLSHGFTLLFEALILQFAMNMPEHHIAKLLKVSGRKIWEMLDRYIDSTLQLNNYSDVDTVGIDDTSISKGHDYLTMFVDLKNRTTIHVAEGKSNITVESFKSNF